MRPTSLTTVPHEMKTSLIKVCSYENKILEGFLVNPYFENEIHFSSLIQLIMLIENMMDDLCFPQRSMKPRSFVDSSDKPSVEQSPPPSEKAVIANFKLSVLFRQNASWQGNISWIGGNMQTPFRSLLEIIHIMDGVLSTGKYVQQLMTVS